ncbi:hypothetical protein DPMN_156203 [Dreissena polymorpha]|uniref:Cadherin domain-containing protein n=1 Tax=Dreissena polymorpha TaxID=45954 RepID=A0A9D4FPD7_DREPO|nr:hypothetical protein DPMN_156203 [Dreissena polymorpha]
MEQGERSEEILAENTPQPERKRNPPRPNLVTLRIRVNDRSGDDCNSVDASLILQITDVNDENPQFTSSQFYWKIDEDYFGKGNTVEDYFVIRVQDIQDTAPGNTILVVSAVDGDFEVLAKSTTHFYQAYEVIPGMHSGTDITSSTTDVWVTMLDANWENPANCKNNGNVLANNDILLPTIWIATLVGNLLRLPN